MRNVNFIFPLASWVIPKKYVVSSWDAVCMKRKCSLPQVEGKCQRWTNSSMMLHVGDEMDVFSILTFSIFTQISRWEESPKPSRLLILSYSASSLLLSFEYVSDVQTRNKIQRSDLSFRIGPWYTDLCKVKALAACFGANKLSIQIELYFWLSWSFDLVEVFIGASLLVKTRDISDGSGS